MATKIAPKKVRCPQCKLEVRADRLEKHLAKHGPTVSALQRQTSKWQGDREPRHGDPLIVRSGWDRNKPHIYDPKSEKSALQEPPIPTDKPASVERQKKTTEKQKRKSKPV